MDKEVAQYILSGNFQLRKADKSGKSQAAGGKVNEADVPMRLDSIVNSYKNKVSGEAKNELEGERYVVANQVRQEDDDIIHIKGVSMKQSVAILTSIGAKIQIEGKVNSVCVNECYDIRLVVDSLISSLDITNCDRITVQVMNTAPTINVSGSTSVSLYLTTEESRKCDIITCKSSSLNVNYRAEDDWVEVPVPDQYTHRLECGKIISEVSEVYV